MIYLNICSLGEIWRFYQYTSFGGAASSIIKVFPLNFRCLSLLIFDPKANFISFSALISYMDKRSALFYSLSRETKALPQKCFDSPETNFFSSNSSFSSTSLIFLSNYSLVIPSGNSWLFEWKCLRALYFFLISAYFSLTRSFYSVKS